jgi:hypothetical protein
MTVPSLEWNDPINTSVPAGNPPAAMSMASVR